MGRRSPHCFQRRSTEAGPSPFSAEAALVRRSLTHPGPRADTAVCRRAVPSTSTAKFVRAQRPPGKPGLCPPSEPRPHVTQTGDGAQRPKQSRNTPGHNGHWSPVRGQGDPGKHMMRPRRAHLLIEKHAEAQRPAVAPCCDAEAHTRPTTLPPREWPHPRRHRNIRRESARAQRPSGHEITPPHRVWLPMATVAPSGSPMSPARASPSTAFPSPVGTLSAATWSLPTGQLPTRHGPTTGGS